MLTNASAFKGKRNALAFALTGGERQAIIWQTSSNEVSQTCYGPQELQPWTLHGFKEHKWPYLGNISCCREGIGKVIFNVLLRMFSHRSLECTGEAFSLTVDILLPVMLGRSDNVMCVARGRETDCQASKWSAEGFTPWFNAVGGCVDGAVRQQLQANLRLIVTDALLTKSNCHGLLLSRIPLWAL